MMMGVQVVVGIGLSVFIGVITAMATVLLAAFYRKRDTYYLRGREPLVTVMFGCVWVVLLWTEVGLAVADWMAPCAVWISVESAVVFSFVIFHVQRSFYILACALRYRRAVVTIKRAWPLMTALTLVVILQVVLSATDESTKFYTNSTSRSSTHTSCYSRAGYWVATSEICILACLFIRIVVALSKITENIGLVVELRISGFVGAFLLLVVVVSSKYPKTMGSEVVHHWISYTCKTLLLCFSLVLNVGVPLRSVLKYEDAIWRTVSVTPTPGTDAPHSHTLNKRHEPTAASAHTRTTTPITILGSSDVFPIEEDEVGYEATGAYNDNKAVGGPLLSIKTKPATTRRAGSILIVHTSGSSGSATDIGTRSSHQAPQLRRLSEEEETRVQIPGHVCGIGSDHATHASPNTHHRRKRRFANLRVAGPTDEQQPTNQDWNLATAGSVSTELPGVSSASAALPNRIKSRRVTTLNMLDSILKDGAQFKQLANFLSQDLCEENALFIAAVMIYKDLFEEKQQHPFNDVKSISLRNDEFVTPPGVGASNSDQVIPGTLRGVPLVADSSLTVDTSLAHQPPEHRADVQSRTQDPEIMRRATFIVSAFIEVNSLWQINISDFERRDVRSAIKQGLESGFLSPTVFDATLLTIKNLLCVNNLRRFVDSQRQEQLHSEPFVEPVLLPLSTERRPKVSEAWKVIKSHSKRGHIKSISLDAHGHRNVRKDPLVSARGHSSTPDRVVLSSVSSSFRQTKLQGQSSRLSPPISRHGTRTMFAPLYDTSFVLKLARLLLCIAHPRHLSRDWISQSRIAKK